MPPQALLIMVLLSAAPGAEGVALPARTRGAATARLTIRARPDAGFVRLTVDVTGGPLLQVQPATLADPAHDWEARRNEWCRLTGGRLTWTQSVLLRQVKPGPAALPDVTVRFQDGPAGAWEVAEWEGILQTPRDAPPPEFLSPVAPAYPWAPWAALTILVLAATAAAWVWLRRRPRRGTPSPEERALGELRRLEESSLTDLSSADYHTALSAVVRAYLAERFHLPATRQTTAEFLRTAARTGRLSEAPRELLREFFERCDLAKFAPVSASENEFREAAALARALVGWTAGTRSAQITS